MSAPAVSVILPTLDRAATLPRAIASVLNQSFSDLELVIVDDGSRDETRGLVAGWKDPRIVYVRNDQPTGDAAARNRGVAQARGAWLAFQDSDDEWAPHSLRRRLELAGSAPDAGAVASALLRVTPGGAQRIAWPLRDSGDVDVDRFVTTVTAYLQSLLVRRAAFDALGGFDTTLRARSDVDFCFRLAASWRMVATNEALAVSHESADSLSGNAQHRRADLLRLLGKHPALIARDRAGHARFLYDLAKAQLACGDRAGALGTVARSLRLKPAAAHAWALLALTPLGAAGLERAVRARRRLGPAR